MDIAAILSELDAEIEKLQHVRKIIVGLEYTVRSRKKKPPRKPLSSPVTAAEPLLTKLPPKSVREHRQRAKRLANGLEHPVRSHKKKPNQKPLPSPVTAAAKPLLIKLPSKLKREYRPRVKSFAQAPIALAAAPSDRPVFVPRAALSAPAKQSPRSTNSNPELLEATFRKNLIRAV